MNNVRFIVLGDNHCGERIGLNDFMMQRCIITPVVLRNIHSRHGKWGDVTASTRKDKTIEYLVVQVTKLSITNLFSHDIFTYRGRIEL